MYIPKTTMTTIYLKPELFATNSIYKGVDVFEYISPYKIIDIVDGKKTVEYNKKRYPHSLGELYPTEKEHLEGLLNHYIPELKIVATSFYLPKHKWGRLIPANYLSMCVTHRPTRHTLCIENYMDIDMVNCHYSIISELIGKETNLSRKHLLKYCADPKGQRSNVMERYGCDKNGAKELFIRLIYGGTINQWKNDFNIDKGILDLSIVTEIEKELIPFCLLVYEKNPEIKKDILFANPHKYDKRTEKEIIKSVVSFWCQSIERYIQEMAIGFVCETYGLKVRDIIPCQDGFMMLKKYFKEDIIESINTHIVETTGLNICFTTKPFDEAYPVVKSKRVFEPIELCKIEDTDFAISFAKVCYGNKPIISTGDNNFEVYVYNGIYWELSSTHSAELFKDNFDNLSAWYHKIIETRKRVYIHYINDNEEECDPKRKKARAKECALKEKAREKAIALKEKARDKARAVIIKKRENLEKLKMKQGGVFTSIQLKEYDDLGNLLDDDMSVTVCDDEMSVLSSSTSGSAVAVVDDELFERINDALIALNKSNMKTIGSCRRREDTMKIFKKNCYIKNIEWNRNKKLFVFEDCVFNLETGLFQPRTNPEDYINQTCGYKYNISNTPEEITEATDNIIEKINSMIYECDYEFLMTYLSSFLEGGNKDNIGMFWLGKGRNGKGSICDLARNAIGKYWGELSMNYLTNHSKDVDRPNQNLYNCRNSNVLNTSEIADDNGFGSAVKFITSIFKNLTGGDLIYAREVGTKENVSFLAGKLLISTNLMPSFSKLEASLKNRIIVMMFPYTFIDDDVIIASNPAMYKKKDVELKDMFKTHLYRRAFMDLLMVYHKKYVAGLVVPPSVKSYSEQYFSSESIKSYLDTYAEVDATGSICIDELRKEFNTLSGKNISIKHLREELVELGLEVTLRCVKGYVMKEVDM